MSGVGTTSFNFCPHCGCDLEEGLARHKATGACANFERAARPPSNPHSEFQHMPALEDAPAEVDVDDEGRRRRKRLADQLEEQDVWTEQPTA